MSEEKETSGFTEGPWHAWTGQNGALMVRGKELPIAEMWHLAKGAHRANARLIAAAPELLAALRDCAGCLEGTPIGDNALAAIAKATGT